jgi:hypothetical protein
MKGLVNWSDGLVGKREKELLSGVTPPIGNVPPPAKALPSIEDNTAWSKYVNETNDPVEKQKRFDEWRKVGIASMK